MLVILLFLRHRNPPVKESVCFQAPYFSMESSAFGEFLMTVAKPLKSPPTFFPIMGIFNKLLFWKKHDEDLDFESLAQQDMKAPPLHEDFDMDDQSLGLEEKSQFSEEHNPSTLKGWQPASAAPRPVTSAPGLEYERDVELISSKLDTIKAMLSSLEQRMSNVEQAVGIEKKQRLW